MANLLTPTDVHAIVNDIVKQATGRDDLKVTDTSSLVTVGETLLRTGYENTINAISTVVGRTIFSIRPYSARFSSLLVDAQRWGGQTRKVVPLYTDLEASEDWNTDLAPQQLADGQSVDMFKIKAPKCVQLNFYGTKLLQKHITMFRDQLSLAFTNETEFARFLDTVMTQFANEIEVTNENKARGTILNYMAGLHEMGLSVDLAEEFNKEYGTSYTRAQLLGTYFKSFCEFISSYIQTYSDNLVDYSTMYHANLSQYAPIPRHTPKAFQKMIMLQPFFNKMKTMVLTNAFNPELLNIGSYEGVNYWQAKQTPNAINITPNILNVNNGQSVNGQPVSLDYVLGVLFDVEACGIMPQFDYASTTPFNSAGGYSNTYNHWRFNSYNDFTENGVLFYIGEGGEVSTENNVDDNRSKAVTETETKEGTNNE